MAGVLLTGATGFVGSHVAERLSGRGHGLRCTVRASSDLRWLEGLDVETAEVDLADGEGLGAALEGVGRVVHVAGVTRAPREEVFRRVNVEGTRRLAEASLRAGVRRFVFVSSLAARGPDGEDGPVSAYGRSKRAAERSLLRTAGATADDGRPEAAGGEGPAAGTPRDPAGPAGDVDPMQVVVLRPGGVYGPRDTDLLPLFRLARSGWFPLVPSSGTVQPIYVADLAEAVVAATVGEAPGPGPWPLAARGRHRWSDLAEGIGEALGRPVRTFPVPAPVLLAAGAAAELAARATGRPPDFDRRSARDLARNQWTCDPSPSEAALGWEAEVALGEGLERTVRWYRREGWL
jgi:nucleoside-diphosphate-sugar epimerase